MAPRQVFLKREPGLARPRPNPASRPKPATRRPPTRDPRVTPWRPRPNPIPKPTPNKPLFPGMPKPKYPVFGRRPAHLPISPGWLGRLRPLRPFLRLHPFLALPFLAWDAYDLYQQYQRNRLIRGYKPVGAECVIPEWISFDRFAKVTRPCDSRTLTPVARYNFDAPYPSTIFEWWLGDFKASATRVVRAYGFRQRWDRDTTVPVPSYTPPSKGIYIPPDPLEMPYPYPFAPAPYPVNPPLTRPSQEPGVSPQPQPQPQPRPAPRPVPVPVGAIAPIPSINYRPGERPEAGYHERRPPTDHEAEKKKRLKPGTSVAWLQFMNQAVGSYTEMDDTIAALYKGLPWHLRRWRGRDGVWRDRDIRSDTRAKRLFDLLGQLDVEKAIEEVIKQELTDAAFGTVGNKLKQKAKDLGDQGLWPSATGFQTGGAKRHETWEEAYEKLRKEGAEKVKTRQYTVKIRVGPGLYRYETRTRPVTQIPWFKQESLYPRMARPGMAEWWTLTAAEKAARKKNVKAYYYAKTRTPRP